MTVTLAEIARWHARQVKATASATRDFYAKPPCSCATSPTVEPTMAATSPQRSPRQAPGQSRIDPAIEDSHQEIAPSRREGHPCYSSRARRQQERSSASGRR
jgi:hypothetical protein